MPDILCDQISDETKAEMEKLISYTEETGNEHGIKLCLIGNKIVNSKRCAGDKCSIPGDAFRALSCPENSEYVSDFHTHPVTDGNDPKSQEFPSGPDITSSSILMHHYTCISSGKNNTYCYKIPEGNIKLAIKLWQKAIDLDGMEKLLIAKPNEGVSKEAISISEDIHKKKFEFNRAKDILGDVGDLCSRTHNILHGRCKVDFESNANIPTRYGQN